MPKTASELRTESELRKKVVVKQSEFEQLLTNSVDGRAVFLTPSILTPLFISIDAIRQNPNTKLLELKPGYENSIPAGLIPNEKLADPVQLDTVLRRVKTLHELKHNVEIFYVEDRKVDDSHLKIFLSEHPNFKLTKITKADYDKFKAKDKYVPEANYTYHDESGQPVFQCVLATQINTPNFPSDWKVLEGEATKKAIEYLNEFLKHQNCEAFHPKTKINPERTGAKPLFSAGTFRLQAEAANTQLIQKTEEPCPQSSRTQSK